MKKILIALFLCAFCSFYGWGQSVPSSGDINVVYLKNGSVIKGKIVEFVPSQGVTIAMDNGSIIKCEIKQIERITLESYEPVKPVTGVPVVPPVSPSVRPEPQMSEPTPVLPPSKAAVVEKSEPSKAVEPIRHKAPVAPAAPVAPVAPVVHVAPAMEREARYATTVSLSYGTCVAGSVFNVAGVEVAGNYLFNDKLSLGGGLGLKNFHYKENVYEGQTLIKSHVVNEFGLPIFVRGTYDIMKGRFSPFVSADLGYTVSLGGNEMGGIMFEPSVGCLYRVSKKLGVTFAIAYSLDRCNTQTAVGVFKKGYANSLSGKIGIRFK